MIAIAVMVLYALMVVFDFSMLAGTVWLVYELNWSAWWFLLTILVISGSSPRKIILAMHGIDTSEES